MINVLAVVSMYLIEQILFPDSIASIDAHVQQQKISCKQRTINKTQTDIWIIR